MADLKISELTNLTAADPANDMIPIVDVSATPPASGSTKRISINNILACSPTATLASATISGALTVDTTTLVVNPAGYPDRVGIGTASPALPLEIYKASGDSKMRITSGANSLTIGWDDPNGFYYTANTSLMAWQLSGSTAMTLNATGLGVGGGPELKLRIIGSDEAPATSGTSTTNGALRIGGASTNLCIDSGVCTTGGIYGWFQSRDRSTYASNYDLVLQKNGGNVGIGVVPIGGKGCLQLSSGINFPATQVASSDANTLDDYEEGTFTPAIEGQTSAGTGTYSIQVGRYTKIGNLVTVQIHLNWTAHTGTGSMLVSGLPFTSSGVANLVGSASIGYVDNLALSAGNVPLAYVLNANTRIQIVQTPTGGGSIALVPMDTAATIVITATYMV